MTESPHQSTRTEEPQEENSSSEVKKPRIWWRGGFLFLLSMLFLNAFVDLGHKIIVQNTIFKAFDGSIQVSLISVVNGLILLPYVMLLTPAGYMSDRFSKPKVMRVCAWGALILTLLITLFYHLGWFWAAFSVTFLMGLQSAFYSPAKIGYIRELVGVKKLANANGVVQGLTNFAILLSIFVFSFLFEGRLAETSYSTKEEILTLIAPLGWFLVLGAICELFFAYRLPEPVKGDDELSFKWREYISGKYVKETLSSVFSHEVIFLSIVGLSMFWALGQTILAAFPSFAKDYIMETNTALIQGVMAFAGIGIVIGSTIAGRISRNHIEIGLVPVGALGITLALCLTPYLFSLKLQALNFLVLGIMGGLFIIPLSSLVQYHAREHEKGRILAASNLIQNVTMLSFLALTSVFSYFGLKNIYILWLLVPVALIGSCYTLYKLPHSFVRLFLSFLLARMYKTRIIGFENIPERGGVLLLGNHISWIDWAVIQIACPRPIRFVMLKQFYDLPVISTFMRIFKSIPVEPGGSGNKNSLAAVTDKLNAGEIVCMFPEGTISQTGHFSVFRRGFERAAKGANPDVKIVPFYMRGLWGTRFSRASETLKSTRRDGPKHDLIVAFGEPIDIETTAEVLKQRVFDLSVSAWKIYSSELGRVEQEWLKMAKRVNRRWYIEDEDGKRRYTSQFVAEVISYSQRLKNIVNGRRVAILMPPGVESIALNMAALMAGKVIVNLPPLPVSAVSKDDDHRQDLENWCKATRERLDECDVSVIITDTKDVEKIALQTHLNLNSHEDSQKDVQVDRQGNDEFRFLSPQDLHHSYLYRKCLQALFILLPEKILEWLFTSKTSYQKNIGGALVEEAALCYTRGVSQVAHPIKISHQAIVANSRQVTNVLNHSNDVMICALPLSHAYGLVTNAMMPLLEGIPLVCYGQNNNALGLARTIAKHDVTLLFTIPETLQSIVDEQKTHRLMLEKLRFIASGGFKLEESLLLAFNQKFNQIIYEGYGFTEATPIVSINLPDRIDSGYWSVQVGNKPGSVGMPLPGTSVKIIDANSGEEKPLGEWGNIVVDGSQVLPTMERVDEDVATNYADDEPLPKTDNVKNWIEITGKYWIDTGDVGKLDNDGFLVLKFDNMV